MKKILALCVAAALAIPGCVKVDNSLGTGLVDKSLMLDTYTVEFPITDIYMRPSSDLSAFSDSHLTIGSIREKTFGLTTREASFPLIPALDEIDLGTNPVAKSFDLYFTMDTVSMANDTQERILQNIYVYELVEPLPKTARPTNTVISRSTDVVTKGIPIFNGSGGLNFSFTTEFAQKYVDAIRDLGPVLIDRDEKNPVDKYDDFVTQVPGICIETEVPTGEGGRINLFNFSCLSVVNNYYQRNNNVGLLTVNSTWDGEQKDSTFMFIPGETEFVDEEAYLEKNTKFSQYCLNTCGHETLARKADDIILVEGGGGLKPVISALELQKKTREAIIEKGGDPAKASIISASIVLPFDMPEDYLDLERFPSVLSPTIRTSVIRDGEEFFTFAGLTDASVSAEDQGDIDRSNLIYSPDITYHMQEILQPEESITLTQEEIEKGKADIWLLTLHTNTVANASGQTAEQTQYYQNLMYASYYNSLYGGGYGGYGSGYNSYNNYYSYMMMAQMMAAQNQTTYTTTTELDINRFYKAVLKGPEDPDPNPRALPHFIVVFAIPQR